MRKLWILTFPLLVILLATCRKSSSTDDIDSSKDSVAYITTGDTIYVNYNGTSVTVQKPVAFDAVTVTFSGGDVIIHSEVSDKILYYSLQGTISNGMFKIYSSEPFHLILNGVNITNSDGPAINNQSGKKCTVTLKTGTSNSLTDGSNYTSSEEDQKATFFSEGPLDFDGSGSLTVKSLAKHGICSDDHISILDGSVIISAAAKDGIHANDYFQMQGGSVNVASTDDGIECEGGYILISGGSVTTVNNTADVKGIGCDSTMVISGGTINVTMGGAQSKGLKSGKNMLLSGGTISVSTSGAVELIASGSGYDPSYCTAVKCDSCLTISGASLSITSTGAGGKGISSDYHTTITSGVVKISASGAGATFKNTSGTTDSYSATCITANGNISILGGSVTTSSSGAGGKGISADGTITFGETGGSSPTINITTTGAKFVVSGSDYNHPKAVKSTGAFAINNGAITISSSDDGIHSETSITQTGGNVTIGKSYEGVESKYITIKGGSMSVTASNDGFNATAGTTSGGTESSDGSVLSISGGTISVSVSSGDGLDSNGSINMSGGTVIVQGPPSAPEVGLDYNGSFSLTGGLLIATGPSAGNMIQSVTTSTQYCVKFTPSSGQSLLSASTIFHIEDASKNNIVTFQPLQSIYYIVFSSPDLVSSTTYSIYTGGSSTGTNTNGFYTGGTYTAGTLKKTFSVSSFINAVSL